MSDSGPTPETYQCKNHGNEESHDVQVGTRRGVGWVHPSSADFDVFRVYEVAVMSTSNRFWGPRVPAPTVKQVAYRLSCVMGSD
jgi:hypothetical protein